MFAKHFKLRSLVPVAALALCALLHFASMARGETAKSGDLQLLKTRIIERLLNTARAEATKNAALVQRWMGELKPDGTWADIDYANQTRGDWRPAAHIRRVLTMARAYACAEHPLHGDPALRAAIHSALGHWLAYDYWCSNWWHNEIGVPNDLSETMLLFEAELTAEEKAKGLKIVTRAKIEPAKTGQNLVWVAGITFMRALIENDSALARSARDAILSEVVLSDKDEGLQCDWSYRLHGPFIQMGNYGLAYVTDCSGWAALFQGTGFAFSESQMAILRQYILEGQRYVYWKGAMDVSTCGRQLFAGSAAGRCKAYVRALEVMQRADPDHAASYQAAIDSSTISEGTPNALIANKHFWRSDFMVDRRSGYYASVRMGSHRVIGSETCNGENLLGLYEGDGAFFLYQSGHEYEDIFPVLDWRKLPGTTVAQTETSLLPRGGSPSSFSVAKGRVDSDFVGGVSDGKDGAAVMDYRREGVAAKKSWFFFEGRVVCLGAGIESDLNTPVLTTVNQCLRNGPVLAESEDVASGPVEGRGERAALKWAWHDGVGYIFPAPVKATLGAEAQPGAWKRVISSCSDKPLTKDVFALWLDHGAKPKGASYQYLEIPGATAEQVAALAKKPDVECLSNTPDLQAVRRGNLTMAVFYQPGKLALAPGRQLEVSEPCIVLLRGAGRKTRLTVADPAQKLTTLHAVINSKPLTVKLPQGSQAGRSVAAK